MNLTVAAARTEEMHYLVSGRFLQQLWTPGTNLLCPILVLPECAAAIARPTGDLALGEELVALIESVPGLRLVSLDLSLAHRAVQIATHHRLRGADSVYVAVAEAFDTALITWDAEMLERGAGIVTTMTPSQWLDEQVAVE